MITTILAALVATAQPVAPAPAPAMDQHQGMDHAKKGCACCKDMPKDKPMACCAKDKDGTAAHAPGHSAH